MESFVPACVWVKEKETARNWMGYKVCTPFSGLPQHAPCGAGLIALSNSQPSLWHHRHPETSQPALMDWLRLSGCQAPDSHGAFVCTQNEVFCSLAENLSDTVSYAFIGQNTKMFSQNIASAHPTVSAEKQNKVTVSPSAFIASPPSTLFFFLLQKQCDIKLESPWCDPSTATCCRLNTNSGYMDTITPYCTSRC